jgi:hypothetical protein
VDDNEAKNLENRISGMVLEVGDIISKFKAKMDSLEQADIELYKAVDQLDAESGLWDTIPKRNIDKKSYKQEKS